MISIVSTSGAIIVITGEDSSTQIFVKAPVFIVLTSSGKTISISLSLKSGLILISSRTLFSIVNSALLFIFIGSFLFIMKKNEKNVNKKK